jgi:RNA polymerase sigma factor (sigma-70 family)
MVATPVDALLEKLAAGDNAAAEQVFLEYEPFLRLMVRRQMSAKLGAKFDSVDIVQSVWADVVKGFRAGSWHFADAVHLKAFLIRITRNRFLNRIRHHRFALSRNQSLTNGSQEVQIPSCQSKPSETARADELWHRMLALCPPAHRELLQLKRQGLSLSVIATRTGLHPSSVRRVLYELAKRLSFEEKESKEVAVESPTAHRPPSPRL